MPVSDFECQIARGQIGRYVEGGALSPQAMTGLEEHLAECPGCKALVAERRAALLGSLAGAVPTKAVVEMPVENPLIAALREKQEAAPADKAKPAASPAKAAPRSATKKSAAPSPSSSKSLGKPLALAALLAVVLLGMSRISQFVGGPASKASMSFAAQTAPAAATADVPKPEASTPQPETADKALPAAPKPETKPEAAPKVSASNPTAKQDDTLGDDSLDFDAPDATAAPKTPVAPKPVKAAAPKPTVSKAPAPVAKSGAPKLAVKRAVRKIARRKVAHKRVAKRVVRKSHSSVRVYGLDGRPLN